MFHSVLLSTVIARQNLSGRGHRCLAHQMHWAAPAIGGWESGAKGEREQGSVSLPGETGKKRREKKKAQRIRLSKRSCDYSSEVGAWAFFPHY